MKTDSGTIRSIARQQAMEIPTDLLEEIAGGYSTCQGAFGCYTNCKDLPTGPVCGDVEPSNRIKDYGSGGGGGGGY